MKKCLVTGGEGFIGFHVCKRLLNLGFTVISYDGQNHYIPFNVSNWPFYITYRTKEAENKNLIRIRGDVADRGRLKSVINEYKPEYIIHLAALPIANVSNDYPEEAHRHILNTTITLLEVIVETNYPLKKLIYTSSSMVYGNFLRDNNNNIITACEEQTCNPIDIYGAMKLSGEFIVKAFSHRFKVPYVIIRPSAVYGPTDSNKRVTEIYVMNALTGKELQLDNGGLHQLDFTYVEDLADGYIKVVENDGICGETFNLTRGEGRTIKDLAYIIKDIIPETKIIDKKASVYRPNRGALDISKARRILGYNPKYNLEEGIRKYIEFIRNVGVLK